MESHTKKIDPQDVIRELKGEPGLVASLQGLYKTLGELSGSEIPAPMQHIADSRDLPIEHVTIMYKFANSGRNGERGASAAVIKYVQQEIEHRKDRGKSLDPADIAIATQKPVSIVLAVLKGEAVADEEEDLGDQDLED